MPSKQRRLSQICWTGTEPDAVANGQIAANFPQIAAMDAV